MQTGIFSTLFYQPLYNTLVFILSVVPGANVGVAIIFLTLVVRGALFPLSHKSVVSQAKMRSLAPHIEKLKEKHKDNKQEQARKTMELYKEYGINPFSGCLLVVVQLPIIFALYYVFFKGLPSLNAEQLYSFVHMPSDVNMMFLGILLSSKSIFLALLASITQYFQIKLSMPAMAPAEKGAKPSFKDEFARSFNMQMRYMLPVIVFGISYSISAAIALYWTTSNLFSIAQELYVARKARQGNN
ncbi:YidC/Oxa1 family membrane protein insertase [Candidatus Berkelbacteria bacterium]|nr:YidC/Oxa1 family membrane protein insertase [Candidatus Berkelbacteria bacterium]